MNLSNKTKTNIIFFIGLFFLVYTSSRAYLIPFTWDEKYTLIEYVRTGFIFFSKYDSMDANNHLLNTWLMEIVYKFLGEREFFLRIPNLLAHLLFLIYSAKFVKQLSSPLLSICSFVILNSNPFILDYFILARGYGLSIGLLMLSLYYAKIYIEDRTLIKHAFLATFYSSLAVLAQLVLLNHFLIISFLLVACNLLIVWNDKGNLRARKFDIVFKNTILILSPLLILIFIIPMVIHLKEVNAFYYGGTIGFWKDVVVQNINDTLYGISLNKYVSILIQFFIIVILVLSIWVLFFKNKSGKFSFLNTYLFLLLILISLCFFANIIQHELLGILYPIGRTALYYIILFYCMMIFLFESLSSLKTKVTNRIVITITLLLFANFIYSINFNYVFQWKGYPDQKDIIKCLADNRKKIPENEINLKIGASPDYSKLIEAARYDNKLVWLNKVSYDAIYSPLNDYFYLKTPDTARLHGQNYKVLKEFPKSNSVLLSNETKWKSKIIHSQFENFETNNITNRFHGISNDISLRDNWCAKTDSVSQFSYGFSYIIDDSLMKHNNSLVTLKAVIYIQDMSSNGNIVVSFEHNSKTYLYQSSDIKEYIFALNQWSPIYFSVIVPKEISKGDLIKCYLWNTSKNPIYIDDMDFKIVSFEK